MKTQDWHPTEFVRPFQESRGYLCPQAQSGEAQSQSFTLRQPPTRLRAIVAEIAPEAGGLRYCVAPQSRRTSFCARRPDELVLKRLNFVRQTQTMFRAS